MGANNGVHGTGYSRQMTECVGANDGVCANGEQIKRVMVECDYPHGCKQAVWQL